MRGAIVLLRQLFLPPCHFAGQTNDHVVFIGLSVNRDGAECSAFDLHGLTSSLRFGILPPIKREALTMKVEWPAFTVERWPNHSPDQLRLQQAPPRGNLGYSITSSARDPGDPRCSALAANRPFAMDIRGVPHHGRQTDVEPVDSRDRLPQALSTYSSFSSSGCLPLWNAATAAFVIPAFRPSGAGLASDSASAQQ